MLTDFHNKLTIVWNLRLHKFKHATKDEAELGCPHIWEAENTDLSITSLTF